MTRALAIAAAAALMAAFRAVETARE